MNELALQASNLSKYYRLGVISSTSLKQDIQRLFSFGTKNQDILNGPSDLWALNGVSFDVYSGEVLGIVGRNGSGKSTLLKILSRIVPPTKGTIRWRGKISSLLEVGTGFHAELTGRENVYLNGQILGLTRGEVNERFDEIVDFSGIEKFLDTPVKRYSSGMYVRLAFAVAAHLRSDILIIDEVLAVGDNEFQQKCIGKMKEISRDEGKAVLFVSHDMQTVRNLCTKAIYLESGKIGGTGTPDTVINTYLKSQKLGFEQHNYQNPASAPGNEFIRIKKAEIVPQLGAGETTIDLSTALSVNIEFWYTPVKDAKLSLSLMLNTLSGDCVFDISSQHLSFPEGGLMKATCTIPGNFLNDGAYILSVAFVKNNSTLLFDFADQLFFTVEDSQKSVTWYGRRIGFVRPDFPIELTQSLGPE